MVRRAGTWALRAGTEDQVARLPEGVRQVLQWRRPAVGRVLEAASVVGKAFTVAAVAAGSQVSVANVEAVCEAVAVQQHHLEDLGVGAWPRRRR